MTATVTSVTRYGHHQQRRPANSHQRCTVQAARVLLCIPVLSGHCLHLCPVRVQESLAGLSEGMSLERQLQDSKDVLRFCGK